MGGDADTLRSSEGIRFHAFFIRDMLWAPFDVRYSKLLKRLSEHEEYFQSELRLVEATQLWEHINRIEHEVRQAEEYRRNESHRAEEEKKRLLRAFYG